DFVMAGAQRYFGISVEIVVWIHASKSTYRGITLNAHKVFVVVNFKRCLERIANLPYEDHTDLYRVADLVVNLDLLAVEVARPQRDAFLNEQRINPEETVGFDSSLVVSEKNQHHRTVGVYIEKPGCQNQAYSKEYEPEFLTGFNRDND